MALRNGARQEIAFRGICLAILLQIGVLARPKRKNFQIRHGPPSQQHRNIAFVIVAAACENIAVVTNAAAYAQGLVHRQGAVELERVVPNAASFREHAQFRKLARCSQRIVHDAGGRRKRITLGGDAYADARRFLQSIIFVAHLIEVEPLDPDVSGLKWGKAPHIILVVDSDPLITHSRAKCVVGRGNGIFGRALRVGRNWEQRG